MKESLQAENADLANDLKQMQQAKQESERKRKQNESQLQEQGMKLVDVNRSKSDLTEKLAKMQVSVVLYTAWLTVLNCLFVSLPLIKDKAQESKLLMSCFLYG